MNLLEKFVPIEKSSSSQDAYSISEFRELQYRLIPDLIKISMNYLSKISNGFFVFKGVREEPIYKYVDAYGYLIKKLFINIENPENKDEDNVFMAFNIPRLVKRSFFYLNGSYYSPCLYVTDKPIIYKRNSIKLYGLINSITMYFKAGNARAIFGGRNIPIGYFLQWFLEKIDPNFLDKLKEIFKINEVHYSEDKLLEYFSNFFNCSNDRESIDKCFNDLFFDEFTKDLYLKSYGKKFSFGDLVYYSLLNFLEGQENNFVDLTKKRIIFAEILMTPFFQRISDMAFNFIYGQRFNAINFGENEIIKHFMINLKHQFFYDLVNFYSAIQTFRASFIGPNMKQPPSEVSTIHESHFGKICPITISAKKPGENISIVPDAKVNKYGIFI